MGPDLFLSFYTGSVRSELDWAGWYLYFVLRVRHAFVLVRSLWHGSAHINSGSHTMVRFGLASCIYFWEWLLFEHGFCSLFIWPRPLYTGRVYSQAGSIYMAHIFGNLYPHVSYDKSSVRRLFALRSFLPYCNVHSSILLCAFGLEAYIYRN